MRIKGQHPRRIGHLALIVGLFKSNIIGLICFCKGIKISDKVCMAEPIPGWPDVKLTHSGSRFGPICHNPGLFMSSCPYIKYHSLNATGPDLGQFELEILHDQGTLMGVFVQLQFSTAVRAVNDVGDIASKYFACS